MQVQGTNDSSIVSKLSSANCGYFKDEWLQMFVGKSQKRSPIINRGYYIRFKAIQSAFQSWLSTLSSTECKNSQIVSLGAGFDSSYFRLLKENLIPFGCRYIEIDFPEVMERKFECIKKNNALKGFFMELTDLPFRSPYIVASNGEYTLLGMDLTNFRDVGTCLQTLQLDFSSPTLFLSECALTYIDVKYTDGLIQWVQQNFPNSAFVTYEQVYPNDGFGIIMRNHFVSLNCPLKSLLSYPSHISQCLRYKEMGWSECSAISMFNLLMSFPEDEKLRLQNLELFDEYEMWHEKCHHYLLIWASQGTIPIPELFHSKSCMNLDQTHFKRKATWSFSSNPELLQRYGHNIALLSSHVLLVSGGFGQVERKHQRLGGLVCYDVLSQSYHPASLYDPKDLLGERMFHSSVKLANDDLVIVGGRSSPAKAFEKVIVIHCDSSSSIKDVGNLQRISGENSSGLEETNVSFHVEEKTVMPVPTWRHSASLVTIEGIEHIVQFGGRSINNHAVNDCYTLNTQTWSWSKIPNQETTPSPKHSHSSATYRKAEVIIAGGLTASEVILNCVHVFDAEKKSWTLLPVKGLLPRYSHTSHIWRNKVFLVGGITSLPGFPLCVGIIDLETLVAIELAPPVQDPENPILLSNHTSYVYEDKIVITGGGGNCFSFGTHFNRKNVIVNLECFSCA